MTIQKFEDIIVWQKSQNFSIAIYNEFKNNKDFSFNDQIKRASISIYNNIAEGFDRSSNADFKRFLNFALASNSEIRSMFYLAVRLDFITEASSKILIDNSKEIARMNFGFIKSLK